MAENKRRTVCTSLMTVKERFCTVQMNLLYLQKQAEGHRVDVFL